jgi:hypothetical protein
VLNSVLVATFVSTTVFVDTTVSYEVVNTVVVDV